MKRETRLRPERGGKFFGPVAGLTPLDGSRGERLAALRERERRQAGMLEGAAQERAKAVVVVDDEDRTPVLLPQSHALSDAFVARNDHSLQGIRRRAFAPAGSGDGRCEAGCRSRSVCRVRHFT